MRGEAMEPNIRNYRCANLAEGAARLVALDDNPTTCTLSYSRIEPGKTSNHHRHPWEHEVYITKGYGTLNCDCKEYQVKEGDAMFIPGNVDHYTLNDGGQGDILRIEINPLEAARSGGARNEGGQGPANRR
jgi:quercetin dioxygenase-like cupin family protein